MTLLSTKKNTNVLPLYITQISVLIVINEMFSCTVVVFLSFIDCIKGNERYTEDSNNILKLLAPQCSSTSEPNDEWQSKYKHGEMWTSSSSPVKDYLVQT